MSISNFYKNTLGANLNNARWSWGAFNPLTNQLFLRVWEDEIKTIDGNKYIAILKKSWGGTSPGYKERKRHIETYLNGAEGYGVLCTAKDIHGQGSRTIKKFENNFLLKFGEIKDDGHHIHAKIIAHIKAKDLARRQTSHSSVVPDIKSILGKSVESTTKETLANARVGQGIFRSQVLELWESQCCVTGSTTLDAIRASHIKPWRKSNDDERLDPSNGLPLIANLDALFDAGLITFDQNGKLLSSKKIEYKERKLFGIEECKLKHKPSEQTLEYLAYHRKYEFI